MSGPILLVILALSIIFIVVMTARYKMNAFLVLILAAYGVGLACGLPVPKILDGIKDGFGSTMRAIGIIIVEGTMIGIILEKTGAAVSMANWILNRVGKNNATVAMGLSGYIVGMPLFCDTGFVVMSPLNKALADRSKIPMAVMAVILSTSLYATHCLTPPHPGPTAAVGILGVDIGKVILLGLPLAIPGALAGYFWATRFGRRYNVPAKPEMTYDELCATYGELPPVWRFFLPIILPILLIALKSITTLPGHQMPRGALLSFLNFLGEPITALLIGVFLTLSLVKKWKEEVLDGWLGKALGASGLITIHHRGRGLFRQYPENHAHRKLPWLHPVPLGRRALPSLHSGCRPQDRPGFLYGGHHHHFQLDRPHDIQPGAWHRLGPGLNGAGDRRRRHGCVSCQRQLFLGGIQVLRSGCPHGL